MSMKLARRLQGQADLDESGHCCVSSWGPEQVKLDSGLCTLTGGWISALVAK